MSDKYILNEHGEPEPAESVEAWGEWFTRATLDRSRIVQQDYVEGIEPHVGVSTVFLGLDHNFTNRGAPVLWESLVMGTAMDGEMRRYTSKAAALRGHHELLEAVAAQYHKENPI